MNRRRFFAVSALAGIAPGPVSRLLLADPAAPSQKIARYKMPLLNRLLSSPQIGFPTLTPNFAAMFAPGAGPIQLVRSETWADFSAQTQTQSNNGYTLSALTTIQSLNRTWFYGAFQKGTGAYYLLRTSDPAAFQQAFTQYQSGYTLVDFNIAWELGQIYYTGYWLANASNSQPAGQMLLSDLSYQDLSTQWTNLSSKQGMRMTRIQAYPQNSASIFTALFAPGTDAYVFFDEPAGTFFTDVTGRFNGNSLVGMAFDPTSGNVAGCWRKKVTPSQFAFNQDWDTLTATAQQASAGGMVLTALTAYPNAPSFDDYFEANEAPFVEGYAYAVAKDGQVIATGGGFARSSHQTNNPSVPFTPDTRMNIASVSKAVTGIALEALVLQKGISLDAPFWPLIQSMVPNPDASVKTVTLRNLAEMKSGMFQEVGEGPLTPPAGFSDIWAWLKSYLSKPLVGTPGVTFFYDNTNFTILQGVIQVQSGMAYTDFVTKYVLVPAGIDPTIFNATPDSSTIATLQYSGPQDTRLGNYWGPFEFVAPGGWISSARELIKILVAMRGTSVLPADVVSEMFTDLIGWDGTIVGNFGTYYHKNGGLSNGLTPSQELNTCVVRLAEGYDIALMANSHATDRRSDSVRQCIRFSRSSGGIAIRQRALAYDHRARSKFPAELRAGVLRVCHRRRFPEPGTALGRPNRTIRQFAGRVEWSSGAGRLAECIRGLCRTHADQFPSAVYRAAGPRQRRGNYTWQAD